MAGHDAPGQCGQVKPHRRLLHAGRTGARQGQQLADDMAGAQCIGADLLQGCGLRLGR